MHYRRLVWLLALFAARSAALAQSPDCGSLALAEQAARVLPPSPGVSGAARDPASGDLLVWGPDQNVVRLTRGGERNQVALPPEVTITALVAGPEPGGLTVLDGMAGAALRLDGAGQVVGRDPLPRFEGEVVDAAVFVGGRWVTGSRDLLRRRYVLRRLDAEGKSALLFATEPAPSVSAIPRFHLTATGREVLMAEFMAPFRVRRLPLEGGEPREYETVLAGERQRLVPDSALRLWRSLAALPLDCGTIQTLADLSGLTRLLVRYDDAGHVARVARIEAPLGLMLSLPEARELIGARRVGTQASELELVFYQWRWVRDPNPSSLSTEEPIR